MYYSFSSASWPTACLLVQKIIAKVSNQKVTRRPKCFSFFFFRQASSKLCDPFTMVFAQTAAFYTEQFTSPSLFHNFEVSRDGSNQSLKNYRFISDAIFKSLSNETIIFQDCWITNTVVCSKTFIVDSVFEQSLVNVRRCRDTQGS